MCLPVGDNFSSSEVWTWSIVYPEWVTSEAELRTSPVTFIRSSKAKLPASEAFIQSSSKIWPQLQTTKIWLQPEANKTAHTAKHSQAAVAFFGFEIAQASEGFPSLFEVQEAVSTTIAKIKTSDDSQAPTPQIA